MPEAWRFARRIEQVFRSQPLILPDRTGRAEARFNAIGIAEKRHLFIVFTIRSARGEQRIRPISARYMHAKKVEAYERSKGP
jgi:uncharacterized DUF497 family protein